MLGERKSVYWRWLSVARHRGGWRPLAPSALPQLDGEAPPDVLDEAGLQRIVVAFAATAMTVALLLRLIESTDSATLAAEPPADDSEVP